MTMLSVPQAAQLLRLSTRTVWRHLADGTLARIKVGPRMTQVPQDSVLAFLAARED